MSKEITRRSFLKAGTAAAVGLTVAPSSILGKTYGHTAAPSDKL
ncbi:MAG: twin-arginine translocation signal domain-containing protein, partial [Bacteroidales bacterium]|nr:twin-arginine translocation signal domain-containing protein [Bacteroidales bacterium]